MHKIKFDISERKIPIPWIDEKDECFNKKCHFFYDETNNHRKFWLKEKDFNASVELDFVLGGVLYFGDSFKADVKELKKMVKLQKSADELKFKHLAKPGSTFLECLEERKIRTFLEWLNETDLYIHYSNINNFYYSLVDIIESLYVVEKFDEDLMIAMKNELYVFAINHYDEFFAFLKRFNYPNVEDKCVSMFCEELIKMISCVCHKNIPLIYLMQILQETKKNKELIFLRDNKENTVIESYYNFYLRPIMLFKNAMHTFDEECEIMKQLDKYELYDGNNPISNFRFVGSKDVELVQVSDCFVGLMGKYYKYVNQVSDEEITSLDTVLTEYQKDTLSLLSQLILKSENMSVYYLHSSESIYEYKKSAMVLRWAINYEKNKRIINFMKERGIDFDMNNKYTEIKNPKK